jgi:glycosyltransferase involved in cell wall biosynthesis
VVFEDPLPKTEIGAWLRAADVGLVHSRRFEVFTGARPNKLFDYMAAGLSIVSTVPGEAWRLIEEAGAGISAPWEDPEALASAIRTLADAPEKRRAMGRRGFEAVSRVHSREATAEALATLLDRVCEEHVGTTESQAIDERDNRVTAPERTSTYTPPIVVAQRGGRNASAAD